MQPAMAMKSALHRFSWCQQCQLQPKTCNVYAKIDWVFIHENVSLGNQNADI